ncbi:MAG TPA: twin-arginine translocase TatA/TatE family subunit [Candidatus Angelobacter sp.]|jgi:sec-independent protein translocase protein TatA|nr:twin-arginine translocase TatA/TatE family subunit [Candidatus Angelobacter sp.]
MDFILVTLGAFGTTEIIVIVILSLLIFGGKKIPELMKGLGLGIREFKKATQEDLEREDKNQEDESKKDR